jgi:hypothetical protein
VAQKTTLDISSLAKGSYIVKVTGTGKQVVKLVVVE